MKEQLISLETAKLAKEKGFEWGCYHHYDGGKLIAHWLENGSDTDIEFRVDLEDLLENYNHKYYKGDLQSAPTQSLLQKWLRDVHGISVLATLDDTLSHYCIVGTLHPQASWIGQSFSTKHVYSSYEQALEAGLLESLKLIKNE